ncbi:YjbF family lipoprotein [Lutimaribacter sp. EGI FJ00015]|nr:YjbF family lipoprotein [Lutimaribacter sp. EGI FJ00015]
MRHKGKLRLGAVLTSITLAAACGNDPLTRNPGLELVREIANNRSNETQAPPSEELIAQALSETEGPLELVMREQNKAWVFMLKLEENRGHETFGSAFRQTATMRNGILTATRGFGGDLMSSDISGVMPFISGRKAGEGIRIMRIIGDEDKTRELRLSCKITPGKTMPVKSGAVNTTAQTVTENCQGEGYDITNTYVVDGNGRSLGAKQWVSPLNGYFLTQTLR